MNKPLLFGGVTALAAAVSVAAFGDEQPTSPFDVITVIGSKAEARTLPGSGAVIDEKTFAIEKPTDINQLLKTVPGVYVREEEGLGLRPNIGIRGATAERSSRITLMEDGVLIAPAPYADPSAYYFPTTLRQSTVEVLKGAPLLRHGPQTTGGVVNLVSTPIPSDHNGKITASYGEYDSRDLHAYYGARADNGFSFLLEGVQRESDGFKDIDGPSRNSGYDIVDYVAKLGWEDDIQRVLFKAQYSEETSDETYLGLTDADLDRDADRRYGLSRIDRMDNHHAGFSLSYSRDLSDSITATVMAYRNDFARDWFKLGGGSALIDAANQGDATAQGQLDGTVDIAGLKYKHNNREYYAQGVELNLAMQWQDHSINVGVRSHEDEVDRYQPVETYDQIDGVLVYQGETLPGASGSDNRVEESDALTFWLTDSWQVTDAFVVNLALRHEDVDSSGVRYGSPDRSTVASRSSNSAEELLPGISFAYDLTDSWQVLAGVHKGFSPLGGGAQSWEEPETSINYEAGVRYRADTLFGEVIAFHSDFDNKSENCSMAQPCSNGATSGTFTTGEAVIRGVEVQAGTQVALAADYQLLLDASYTYTEAELTKDDPVNGFFDGDLLADVPGQLWSLRAGLETGHGYDAWLVAKYTDTLCSSIGCNRQDRFGRSEDYVVVDFIGHYNLSDATQLFLKVQNLFDEQAIVSRVPDGARPNLPRTATVGVEYTF